MIFWSRISFRMQLYKKAEIIAARIRQNTTIIATRLPLSLSPLFCIQKTKKHTICKRFGLFINKKTILNHKHKLQVRVNITHRRTIGLVLQEFTIKTFVALQIAGNACIIVAVEFILGALCKSNKFIRLVRVKRHTNLMGIWSIMTNN